MWILKILFLWTLNVEASIAPIDLSQINDEPKSIYFGELGYKIHAENTDWYQVASHLLKSKTVQAEYRSLDEEAPSRLTVRSETLNKNLSLPEYIRRSSKDYRRFGFKILNTRPINIGPYKAYVLDLDKLDSDFQSRQILFKRNSDVIILTCTGNRIKFQSDIKSCNQIARNFTWVKPN